MGRLTATTRIETFFSREKERISTESASGGLCPLDTYDPFKKGSILNFLASFFGRVFRFGKLNIIEENPVYGLSNA